jgi:hypothetical protein
VLQKTKVGSAPVSVVPKDAGLLVTCIGRFYPSDAMEGSVVFVPKDMKAAPLALLTQLRRPTDARLADLNQDGREDLVVCAFGNLLGQFAWYENTGNGRFSETALLEYPGATRTELHDFNRDGRQDIIVLCGQAREAIHIFYNQGQGSFTMESVLQEHPAYGLVDFQLTDWDRDGDMDLVTANGDNGDIPAPHKPYHGIRIYLNNGKNNFTESFFYPMEGAYKAVAADFDLDGDMDLAAIAFFPDFNRDPLESFIYFENTGGIQQLVPRTIEDQSSGRWIAMDAGDMDGDGDVDLALGSFLLAPTTLPVPDGVREHWKTNGAALLILENLNR